ncbi:MAG: chemosensory pili system protein ChpA (sensor histidine kinase/response regulator) [Planctomycetaceae bacterium]|jgi:chemosensory pili system protein ChpA (sensor histidine kinase/response regulator)
MSASQDFVALDWIKADISETLVKAQHSLESVSENGEDAINMRACLTALHQVHGTLKMVEITGPVLVAAEMEALAQALMNNQVPDVGHAQELLMQTILLMPAYLDRIQREQQDNPQFVRPTVNNLRVSRGAGKLEAEDDLPATGVFADAPADLVIERYGASDGPATVKKLRARYQQAVSALLKKKSARENLGLLAKVLQMQAKLCRKAPSGYFAEAMLAVVEGVANGALKFDGGIAGQLRKYDSLLKALAEGTPDSLELVIPQELVNQLQTTLEKATKVTPRIVAARQLFVVELSEASLTEDVEFDPDDETVATVSKILIEELNGVTDKLDLYVRSSARQNSDLVELVPLMEQISSTLVVVGKSEHQQSILRQIETIGAIDSSEEQPGDELLLEIAGSLLEISADLNRLIGDVGENGETDHFGDLDEAQASVIRETRIGLTRSKDAVVDYISNSFAKDKLETLAVNLRSLGSGLVIVNQQRCTDVLAACSRYIDEKLLGRDIQPSLAELDDLADAITSIDYFLERLLENSTDPYWQMVEVAETAISKLGYSVTENLSATVISEALTPVEEPVVSEDVTAETLEPLIEQPVIEQAATEINSLEAEGLDSAAEDLDEAIELEVYEKVEPQVSNERAVELELEEIAVEPIAVHTEPTDAEDVFSLEELSLEPSQVTELTFDVESEVSTISAEEVDIQDDAPSAVHQDESAETSNPEDSWLVTEEGPQAASDLELDTDELETPEAEQIFFELDDLEVEADGLGRSADSELDQIFIEEAEQDFAILMSAVNAPQPGVDAGAIAAYQTLKGSSGMAEAPAISVIAGSMEMLLARMWGSSQPMNGEVRQLMAESLELMQQVISDLAQNRIEFEPGEQFANKVGVSVAPSEPTPIFEFHIFRHLNQAESVLRDWQAESVKELQIELLQVIEQAKPLGHDSIVELCQTLEETYRKTDGRPDSEAMDTLFAAHETLIHMFDQLASSQRIVPATTQIAELVGIDFSRPEARQRHAVLADEITEALQGFDERLAEFRSSALNESPNLVRAELGRLLEHPAIQPEISITLELMLRLAEVIATREDELLEKLAACRAGLTMQLQELSKGSQVALEVDLVASCSNALALRSEPALSDDIDDDVSPLFFEEAEELAEALDECILTWRGDANNLAHLDLMLRHLHTLKGGARLAGLNLLGEFTHNFETFLIGIQQSPIQLDDSFFTLLNERQDEISRRIEIYLKFTQGSASQVELDSMRQEKPVAAFEAEQSTSPEDDIDEDVLPIFVEEAEELLEAIDQCILGWSSQPQSSKFYDDMLRYLHTLKGGARLAGINSLGEVAHNFETYLIGIQQHSVPLDDDFFASLNVQQDEVTRHVEVYTKMAQGDVSDAELASLNDALAAVVPIAARAMTPLRLEAAPVVAQDTVDESSASAASNQEMVRVSAELLESLIGLAGESNITRGRVEQQIRDFGESLQEMEETINRVREQVRRLEIEAESKETVVRQAREEREGGSGFDDLEFDRYTMLQEISRTLSESSSDMLDLKETLTNKSRDAETLLHLQARIGTELQDGLTRTRMVPFARLIPRLRRIVRQISTEVGKSVRFDAFNVEGELDRSVLERIVAPLEHMLRNAVDHGIESTDKRLASNKPETGRISLRLSREGGYVVLTISDDGGGINVGAVRQKAIERGVMAKESTLSDHDIMQFIMHAGFSTAEELTQISGRGVGMDVVNSEIKQLGGSVSIDSTLGVGSEFTIHIPFTVSINRALLVVVREETYAVPLNTIEGIVRVSPYELEAYYQPDAPMFEYAGQPYRLAYMGKMLEKGEDPVLEGLVAPLPVILARSGENSVALQVDRVIGSREIVSKSLGRQFSNVACVSGATVMGDGSVVVILDVLAFIRKSEALVAPDALEQAVEVEQLHRVRKVLIVDDSVTVRKVTSRFMERQGWEVTTAKDGIDAMNQLQDIYPDVVLLDIEMPKMDGFEVLKSVRRDPRLEKLPIIMITSRTGEKHKKQAFELGVNQYIGKPFQEASLMSTIDEVLAEAGSTRE